MWLPTYFQLMTLYQFNQFNELEKLKIIWEHAALVAEREDETNCYKLHQLGSFYVEVERDRKYNIRRALRSFSSSNTALLQPYLDQIDLKNL